MKIPFSRPWDTTHVIYNPQNVGQRFVALNSRSIATGEATQVAPSSPLSPSHNLGANPQSETISTISKVMTAPEDVSKFGRPQRSQNGIALLRASSGQTRACGAKPKRNRIALIQEEEMNNFREYRAGISHISELLAEDDTVEALRVEELGMEHGFHALAETKHQNEFMHSSKGPSEKSPRRF